MPKVQTTKIYRRIEYAKSQGYTTVSAQGSSRCFAKGTLIRMHNGQLKPIEDICVGDRVMAVDGRSYNTVIDTHKGVDKLYCVHQTRGIDYVVNSKHILTLKQTRGKSHKVAIPGYKSAEKRRIEYIPADHQVYDFDIEYYISQSKNFKKRYTGYKQTLIELPKKDLPIDPYYLGMWLGDGCSARPHDLTNIDKEILDYFYEFAKSLDTVAYQVDKVTHRIKIVEEGTHNKRLKGKPATLHNAFKAMNLIGNKHIPEEYIYTSVEDRLKLLAGLIDTDGCVSGRNTLVICQTNETIIDAIEEICHITGFFTLGKRKFKSTMKRTDGTMYQGVVYSIEINASNFDELNKYILIPRKRIHKQCNRDYWATGISVEEIGEGEYYGFELDNSPYFMLRDGTVCHNSSKTYNIMIWLIIRCMQVQGTTVSVVRKTLTAARRSVVRDFKEIMINIGIWNDKNWKKGEFIYYFDNGSWMEFFGADNEQKLRGSKRKVLYVNEGNELTFIEWQQLQMRTTLFSIIDYNPSFSDDHWICSLNAEEKTFHFISTYKDNPFLEKKVVDEIESLQWKNPSLWRVYGLGLQAIIEGLIFENVEYIDEIPRWVKKRGFIGMDFGYTFDPTAIEEVWIYGDDIYIDEIAYQTKLLTGEIINILKEHRQQTGRNFKIISESADPRLVDEIYNAGLDIHAVRKFPGSVMAGITKMLEMKIHVTKRSVNITKEFKNYTYRQDKEGHWLNEPAGGWDHAIDGIRYCIISEVLGGYGQGLDAEDIVGMM